VIRLTHYPHGMEPDVSGEYISIESLGYYLKGNLSIEIDQVSEFGPIEGITVKLLNEGELISESFCALPSED